MRAISAPSFPALPSSVATPSAPRHSERSGQGCSGSVSRSRGARIWRGGGERASCVCAVVGAATGACSGTGASQGKCTSAPHPTPPHPTPPHPTHPHTHTTHPPTPPTLSITRLRHDGLRHQHLPGLPPPDRLCHRLTHVRQLPLAWRGQAEVCGARGSSGGGRREMGCVHPLTHAHAWGHAPPALPPLPPMHTPTRLSCASTRRPALPAARAVPP